jgi:hypothetical protein
MRSPNLRTRGVKLAVAAVVDGGAAHARLSRNAGILAKSSGAGLDQNAEAPIARSGDPRSSAANVRSL